MKIGLDITNLKKGIKPSEDDVVIFDGKSWYITTKESLFKEYDERFSKKLAECDAKIQELEAYRVSVAQQLLEFGEIIAQIVEKENNK